MMRSCLLTIHRPDDGTTIARRQSRQPSQDARHMGWSSGTAPRSVLVPIAGSVPNGHDGDRTGDVFGEVFQVAGVTCVYVIAATSGGLDDDGINDVGGSGAAA